MSTILNMFFVNLLKCNCNNFFVPRVNAVRKIVVLGIETSFDDTGCAVVTDKGRTLGESLNSQALVHLRNGGAIPPIARDLHEQNMDSVVQSALEQSGLLPSQIDAIAATVKPGLSLSLLVGARYGQKMAREHNKLFIPIHHMEAHALSIRMINKIEFPFLVLLISGGHCLLAIAEDVDKYALLGQSMDDAPGEAFDKVARRLKLTNIPEFREMGGGQAIEKAALWGDPTLFQFTPVMMRFRDCNFSFSGLKSQARRYIMKEETKFDVPADGVIPRFQDLCASFQLGITRHICHRVQRALEYIELKHWIPPNRQNLVVAGGVACNRYICYMLRHVASRYGYKVSVPSPSLCTDNGLMIAWNGIERLQRDIGVVTPDLAHTIDIESRCSFGKNHSDEVTEADMKCDWIKLPKDRAGDLRKLDTTSAISDAS